MWQPDERYIHQMEHNTSVNMENKYFLDLTNK
jgi:hypothetical protein